MSMRFKKEKGLWFELDESNPGLARICMRELTLDEVEDIDSRTSSDKDKIIGGVAFTKTKVDQKRARKLQMEKAIVDWEGIFLGDDTEAAECNAINRVRIMKQMDFVKLLLPIYDKLNESNVSLAEARVKNSEDTSPGTTD